MNKKGRIAFREHRTPSNLLTASMEAVPFEVSRTLLVMTPRFSKKRFNILI